MLPAVFFRFVIKQTLPQVVAKVPCGIRTTVPDSNWEMSSRANNVGSRENNVASPPPLALSLSVHHVCRDDDDEFALLDAHDVPARTGTTRRRRGGGVLPTPASSAQTEKVHSQSDSPSLSRTLPPSLFPSWKLF